MGVDRIGRYRITKELGRGAMGVVYQAVDPTIGRTLAIKTIRLREVDDPAHRDRLKERLFREARSAGVLSHPNIVTIYDMEEDDGVAYIAMQFVNGPTLDEVMSRPKPMAAQEMFRVLRQTASALDFAHAKGIVHRDIKPANIMIDEQGTAKIADFGIAKVGTSGNLTLSGTILGTPNYMSPEQVQGKLVDGRADQFSLAVVAYEILTGERPFSGEHLGTVVYKIVAEEPAVLHRLNPSLSLEIDAVIRKGLSKKADDRYKSCIDFVNALEGACLQADGWQSLARGTSHSIPTEAEPPVKTRAPQIERTARKKAAARPGPQKQRKASMFWPALEAFLVVLGALALMAWQAGLWLPGSGAEDKKQMSAQKEPTPAETRLDDVETPPPAPVEPPKAEETHPSIEETHPAVDQPPTTGESTPIPSVVRKPVRPLPELKAPVRVAAAAVAPPALANTQVVYVQSNPPGATALLDNRADTACETPCLLLATPGPHILSLTLASFQKEIRPLKVGEARLDVPLISMQPNGGTLMIVTDPPGANIFVDDRLLGSMTPAQILLPPGSHLIKVALNDMHQTKRVDVTNGSLERMKITLTP